MRKTLLTLFLSVMLLFSGCAASRTEETANADNNSVKQSFTDDLEREVFPGEMHRVAILSGSLADIWYLAGGSFVAVTKDCFENYPQLCGEETKNLGSPMAPDTEAIVAAEPDFVILSGNLEKHRALEETLSQLGIPCAFFTVDNFEDYLRMLCICSELTGCPERYDTYGIRIKEEIEQVQREVCDLEHPKVLLLRAASANGVKIKGNDTVAGAMLEDLYCVNIADEDPSLFEEYSMESILAADPDFVFLVVMDVYSDAEQLELFKKTYLEDPAWSSLRAIQQGNFYVLPTELYHQKPNEKWAEAFRGMADMIYGIER